jgi:hypothetical protein
MNREFIYDVNALSTAGTTDAAAMNNQYERGLFIRSRDVAVTNRVYAAML